MYSYNYLFLRKFSLMHEICCYVAVPGPTAGIVKYTVHARCLHLPFYSLLVLHTNTASISSLPFMALYICIIFHSTVINIGGIV